MIWRPRKAGPRESGQSMVEAALTMPLLLVIALNGVNFGYFFLVAINLVSAPRAGLQYSIEGFSSPTAAALPVPGPATSTPTVAYVTAQDMNGSMAASSTGASIQVCSKVLGLNSSGSSQVSRCATFGSVSSFPSPDPDPEAPSYVLNRVDVTYSFVPLIPGSYFNLALLPTGYCSPANAHMTCTLHTAMSMRALD